MNIRLTSRQRHLLGTAVLIEDSEHDGAVIAEVSSCSDTDTDSLQGGISPAPLPPSRSFDKNDVNQETNEFFRFPCSTTQLAKQRVKFFVFLRLLMKYLEIHDAPRHTEVQSVLQDFCTQSRHLVPVHQDEGSFLWELYTQVKALVTQAQWQGAHYYFRMFLTQRRRHHRSRGRRGFGVCAVVSFDGS